jgi:hypothetical protein
MFPTNKGFTYTRFIICTLALLAVVQNLKAQKLTSSPYTRYGIGDIYRPHFSLQYGLGGASAAITHPAFINVSNPASYAWADLTVFETGIRSNTNRIQSSLSNQWTNNSTLGYVAFAMPFTKHWGFAFGLMPYSSVGYKMFDSQYNNNLGTVSYQYLGSGGINKVFVGNAIKIKNKLALGFNASYLFGNMSKERTIFIRTINSYNTYVKEEMLVSDFTFDAGMQFKTAISKSKEWNMALGAAYSLGDNINAQYTRIAYAYSGTTIKDTGLFFLDSAGVLSIPQKISAGIAFDKGDKWIYTVDYSMQNWSDFRWFGNNDSLQNITQLVAAVQYCPERYALNNFFKSLQYRMALRVANTPYVVKDTPINEYGITFGFGMPLRRSRSTINLGIEIGERGTLKNNLIKEQFINVNFGVSISDKWFIKPKYD